MDEEDGDGKKNAQLTAPQNRRADIKPCVSAGASSDGVTRGSLVSWCIFQIQRNCCSKNKKKIEVVPKQMSRTIEGFMSQISQKGRRLMKRSRTSSCLDNHHCSWFTFQQDKEPKQTMQRGQRPWPVIRLTLSTNDAKYSKISLINAVGYYQGQNQVLPNVVYTKKRTAFRSNNKNRCLFSQIENQKLGYKLPVTTVSNTQTHKC